MMAPEIQNSDTYSKKVDIWALGLVLLEIVNLKISEVLLNEIGLGEHSESKIIEIFE